LALHKVENLEDALASEKVVVSASTRRPALTADPPQPALVAV